MLGLSTPQLSIQRWQGSEWASRKENEALQPIT